MNVPVLRFPEFGNEWPSVRVGIYLTERATAPDDNVPLYSLTIESGVVPKSARYEREFLVKDGQSAYKLMLEGDFAFNPMNLRFGALGRHKGAFPVKVSKYYNIFSFSDEASKEFFEAYLLTNKMIGFYNKMATGSLNEKRRVHYLDFVNFRFPTPSLPEQKKIAKFLGVFDAKIAGLKARQEELERYKRGLMQALFSQRLRFTKPDGTAFPDWEEKRLGDVVEVVSGLTYTPDDIRDNGLLVLRSSNVKTAAITLTDQVFVDVDVEADKLTQAGDILLCVRNGSQRLIGKSALVPENMPKATHGAFMSVLRGANNALIFQLMQTDLFFKEVHKNLGATINSINSSDLKKFKFRLPKHPDEQQKIADALQAMDVKIAVVAGQVAKMEEFKKGLLQQMFV